MSWWRRLLGMDDPAPEPPIAPPSLRSVPTPLAPTSEVTALRKLRSLDQTPVPPDEAVAALRSMIGTGLEKDALEAVRRAARGPSCPEPLRSLAAELFLRRGEPDEALSLLQSAMNLDGLVLRAEAQAALGDLASACASLERVLARDIAAPGILERLELWRSRLGLPLRGQADLARDATLFTAAQPSTPFRIVGEAGRGGAAVVYEAEDDALGRKVALKVYHRPEGAREQLEREACLASSVAGPGVVRVLDVSLDDGWLALEWVAGGTLRDLLRRRELAWLLPVSSWLDPLLGGLVRLHKEGWAHGDIKPGNVLFHAPGRPRLTDFGLARRPGEPWSGGTPGYLSPARLANQPASLADDVYALGRLLEDVLAVVGDEAAPGLRALAGRCLADDRPASVADLVG